MTNTFIERGGTGSITSVSVALESLTGFAEVGFAITQVKVVKVAIATKRDNFDNIIDIW
ncbi:hypothetical protein GM3709_3292 [Geminocystis sp. NIES-3709]|nr:hypothetical protein GM3709_3292 [Geminocystis sp. NIES-3709]